MTRPPPGTREDPYTRSVLQDEDEQNTAGQGAPDARLGNRPERESGFGGGEETRASPFHAAGTETDPDEEHPEEEQD